MNGATKGIVMSNKYKTLQQWFANKKRWCKNQACIIDDDYTTKACCLSYAIGCIYVNSDKRQEVREKIEKFVFNVGEGVSIPAFNDDPETTIEDIRRVVEHTNT